MVGGPGAPLLSYPTMSGYGASVPSPGMYYNRDYGPSGLGSFPKTSVEGGYEWRGTRQQCGNSKFILYLFIVNYFKS